MTPSAVHRIEVALAALDRYQHALSCLSDVSDLSSLGHFLDQHRTRLTYHRARLLPDFDHAAAAAEAREARDAWHRRRAAENAPTGELT